MLKRDVLQTRVYTVVPSYVVWTLIERGALNDYAARVMAAAIVLSAPF